MKPHRQTRHFAEWEVVSRGRRITLRLDRATDELSAYTVDPNDLNVYLPEDEAWGWARFFSIEMRDGSKLWDDGPPSILERVVRGLTPHS